MIPWSLLLFALLVRAETSKTRGVAPALLSKYTPAKKGSAEVWTCLDGQHQIPWAAVNDDYCDCPDGSDEPGTSACPDTTFYCANEGHIPASIRSSRVNDGLCEPECCDGSDEPSGVCPNVCKEVGEKYKQQYEAEMKIRKTGAKIRSTYLAFAKKEKVRLEKLVATTAADVAAKEKELVTLKELYEHAESVSKATLEHRKKSPLYESLVSHAEALKAVQDELKERREREKTLGDILEALRTGYNPNYQDMAVLEAVRGWEQLSGSDVPVDEDELGSDDDAPTTAKADSEWASKEWEELDRDVGKLLDTDYISLLLAHDKHVGSPAASGSMSSTFSTIREGLLSWLPAFGIATVPDDNSAETSKARDAYNNAESALKKGKKEFQDARQELSDLFDPTGYGAEGQWKKLESVCLSTEAGDYIYEVCLFDEARQKPAPGKGGQTHSLGKFDSWNKDAQPGEPAYYTKQHYRGGAKCWNGPNRSVNLVLKCGTENTLHAVTEPEKCEYQFTGTSPALCLPIETHEELSREEL